MLKSSNGLQVDNFFGAQCFLGGRLGERSCRGEASRRHEPPNGLDAARPSRGLAGLVASAHRPVKRPVRFLRGRDLSAQLRPPRAQRHRQPRIPARDDRAPPRKRPQRWHVSVRPRAWAPPDEGRDIRIRLGVSERASSARALSASGVAIVAGALTQRLWSRRGRLFPARMPVT